MSFAPMRNPAPLAALGDVGCLRSERPRAMAYRHRGNLETATRVSTSESLQPSTRESARIPESALRRG